ncbi:MULTISPECIES: DUF3592 domain-containing protein [Arenibacter]|uniref:DUF3592 domain-containing protein n=1 Tax=Arenibacter TaxID=178469 RepID=UPI000A39A33D|nr:MULTISPECIES: DUF3592 domain-containing protein [Arenibacter]
MNLINSSIASLLIMVIFGLLILLFGLGCYYLYQPINTLTHNNRYQWEKIEGEIVEVTLNKRPNHDLPEEAAMVFPIEECVIQYAYNHNGETYTNASIGLNGEKAYDNSFHNELYLKLKDKEKVMVYYNPNNPSQSSLIRYDVNLKSLGTGIALMIFPFLLGYWAYIRKKHPPHYLADQITVVS